jgi:hypothetical protein
MLRYQANPAHTTNLAVVFLQFPLITLPTFRELMHVVILMCGTKSAAGRAREYEVRSLGIGIARCGLKREAKAASLISNFC